MNPLRQGRRALGLHCNNVLGSLEATLEAYNYATQQNHPEAKTKALQQMQQYSQQLVLLEPFSGIQAVNSQAQQLQKICVLLARENIVSNYDEEQQLLVSFYRTLADLAAHEYHA